MSAQTAALAEHAVENEIVITRTFDAPRHLVFKAWTDPKHVERWWGPSGFVSRFCELDLRAGGYFRLQMSGPDGAVFPCEAVISEVAAPERIVYRGVGSGDSACGAGIPPNACVTVTFIELDGKTQLTIHTRLQSAAQRAAVIENGYDKGWASTFERLSSHLA